MKVIVNKCFGGFGLSDEAYERLIELGIPVRKYIQETRDETTGRYNKVDENEGRVIFDNELSLPGEDFMGDNYHEYKGKSVFVHRYWECWTRERESRTDPLLLQVIEELGERANSRFSKLEIVEIPDDVNWEIDDCDGMETVHEEHRSW